MIRTAAPAAALVMTGGLPAATGGIASASDAPRIAAAATASSTPARHVVVLEFCTLKSSELCWMTLMAQFNMTEGPAVWAAHIRWSGWGNSSATGSGTLWRADAGIFRLGHVTIHLYRPRSYVTINGHRHPYFTRVHIIGGRDVAHYWHWVWPGRTGTWAGL
jgi:hypothetical protein